MSIERTFMGASQTGKEIYILKAIGDCDCFDPDDLINSEPNPHCPKCFGTSKERLEIKTGKLRYDYSSTSQGNLGNLENDILESTSETFTFYLPINEIYGDLDLNNDDIVYTTDNNAKFFEVTNKFEYIYDNFSYNEIIAKKIAFINGVISSGIRR